MPQTIGIADHAVTTADPTAIEPKVAAATAASATSAAVVLPFLLWLLSTYLFHGGTVPLPVEGFAGLIVAGGLTFGAGYRARHVDRKV